MKYEDLMHRIIGWAMKVHSALGNGFQEDFFVEDTIMLETKAVVKTWRSSFSSSYELLSSI